MGMDLTRCSGDGNEVSTDFRFLDLLLRAADDPEVGLGSFARGVRVVPGVRMPRLPALYKQKKKGRLASQADPRNYLEDEEAGGEQTWRRNYASLNERHRQGHSSSGRPDTKGPNHQAFGGGCRESVPEPRGRVPWGQRVFFPWHPWPVCEHSNKNHGPRAITSCIRPQVRDARESLSG